MKVRLYIFNFLNFLIFFLIYILDEPIIREYGYWFFLIQLIVGFVIIVNVSVDLKYFLSPSFLTFSYLCLSYYFGHFVVANSIGFKEKFHNQFLLFESVGFITFFLLFNNLIVYNLIFLKYFRSNKNAFARNTPDHVLNGKSILISIVSILLIFGFSYLTINIPFFGSGFNFNYIFILIIIIYFFNYLSEFRSKLKYIIYLIIVAFVLLNSFDSKREILYVIVLILFLESFKNNIKFHINYRTIVLFIFICLAFFILIIWASLLRGYGGFEYNSPFHALWFIDDYIFSNYFVDAFVANLEINYSYGNTSNAINYVYTGAVDLLYGETFLKIFWLPIPRTIDPFKPLSMIEIYTSFFDPVFRSRGGSYPVGIYAEIFWNFGYFFPLVLFGIFYSFNFIYYKLLYLLKFKRFGFVYFSLLFLYITMFQFIRGSGIELWLLYYIISLPLLFLISKIYFYKL